MMFVFLDGVNFTVSLPGIGITGISGWSYFPKINLMRVAPILRSIPCLVVGIPVLRAMLCFTPVIPKNRLSENEKPLIGLFLLK